MSFGIIIRKDSLKFKPHFNRELGNKVIYTKEEYTHEMKKRGLEPYDPSSVKPIEKKSYKPSKEARVFINSVKNSEDKDGKVRLSGNQTKWLKDRLSTKSVKPKNLKQGGFEE